MKNIKNVLLTISAVIIIVLSSVVVILLLRKNKLSKSNLVENKMVAYESSMSYDNEEDPEILKNRIKELEGEVTNLRNLNTYVTDKEVVIGKWIDGKPLYRKTFYRTDTSSFNPNLDNPEMINIKGSFQDTDGTTIWWGNMSYPTVIKVYYNETNHNVTFEHLNYIMKKIYVIIEYTKTTDSAT